MNPQLLQQLTAQLQQMQQGLGAASSAAASLTQALQASAGGAAAPLKNLNVNANRAATGLNNLADSIPTWKLSLMRLAQAAGQAVAGHMKFAASMLSLNRTVYESEDVFANMNAKLTVGQEAISNALQVLSTTMQAIPVFGTFFSTALDEAGKAALNIANEQFSQVISASTQVYEGFRKTTGQFGSLTTNLDKFSQQAASAGLTSGQFGRMLSDNAQNLTTAFGNLSEGAEFVSKNFAILTQSSEGKALLRQFRGIGMEINDVAESLADYAALQRLTGADQIKSGREQIENTFNYVGQLKMLQAITGEDIKTQRQRQRELLQEAAFRGKYDQMVAASQEDSAKNMMFAARAAAGFGPAAEKAFKELAVYGQVVTKESALFASMNQSVFGILQDLATTSQQSGLKMQDFDKIVGERLKLAQPSIKAEQDILANSGLLAAGLASNSEQLQTIGKNFVDIQNFVGRIGDIDQSLSTIRDNLKKTAELGAIGDFEFEEFYRQQGQRMEQESRLLTKNGEMLKTTQDFLKAMDDAQKEINTLYSRVAGRVAETVANMGQAVAAAQIGETAMLKGLLTNLNNLFQNFSVPKGAEGIQSRLGELQKDEIRLREETAKGLKGAAQKLRETEEEIVKLQAILPKKREEVERTRKNWEQSGGTLAFDEGGIASGPKSGYHAVLHGIEAVVPLPDGRTIPVALDTSTLESTMRDLTDRISSQTGSGAVATDLARYLEANNAITRELLRELRRGNEISDKMFKAVA